jgi:hypothetical protein
LPMEWSALSEAVSFWFDAPGPWVIEGTPVVRALRKWLARNPTGKPCDELVMLWTQHEPLLPGQSRMGAGVRTVLGEIRRDLESRGVLVSER